MAIQYNDNLAISLNKPLDARYFTTDTNQPFSSVLAANTAIVPSRRHLGLTVLIGTTTTATEYWYMGGTADGNLVAKTSGVVSANNGLNVSGTTVKLGGPLLANTSIDLSSYTLTLKSATTYTTGIEILPGTPTSTFGGANKDVTIVTGNLKVTDFTYLGNNVGIGSNPLKPIADGGNGTRLFVYRDLTAAEGWPSGNTVSQVVSADGNLQLSCNTAQAGTISSRYAGISGRLGINFGANTTLNSLLQAYTGVFGYMQYYSRYNTVGSYLSGVTAQCYFEKVGGVSGVQVQNVATIRAMAPINNQTPGTGWGGTISQAIGVLIEDQRYNMNGLNPSFTGTITTSYGIKQEGEQDINQFNAIVNKMPYLPVYADNSAAGSLAVGTIYRTPAGQLMVKY